MGLFSRKKQEEVIVPDEDYFKPVEEIEVESLPVGKVPNVYMENVDTLSNEIGLDNNINYSNAERVDTPTILFDDDIVDAPVNNNTEPEHDISSIIGIEPTYQQPMMNNYIQQPVESYSQQIEPQPSIMQEPQNNIFGAPAERRFIGEVKSEEPIYRKKEEVSPIHGNMSIFNTQQIPTSNYDNQVGGKTR